MKTEGGGLTTKLAGRFSVTDFRNGNERQPSAAAGFLIH
jgi:hypothetical protein